MRGMKRVTGLLGLSRPGAGASVDVRHVAGGTLVRGAAEKQSDLSAVMAALGRGSDRPLVIVSPAATLSPVTRDRLRSLAPSIGPVLIVGHPDAHAHRSDELFTYVRDRFDLRDAVGAYWASTPRPAIGVVGRMTFELAVALDEVLGTGLAAAAHGARRRAMKIRTYDAAVDLISGYGAVVREAYDARADYVAPSTVAGMGVVAVGTKAFAGRGVTTAWFPQPLRTIGEGAFSACEELRSICLPGTLDLIDRGAFEGCTALDAVVIPEGVRTIAEHAFRGCARLTRVSLPSTLVSIAAGAFDGCSSSLVFAVQKDSFGHRWARENRFACDVLSGEAAPSSPRASTARITRDGIAYLRLYDGALEVAAVDDDGSSRKEIPASLDGLAVKGLGYQAVPAGSWLTSLRLPASVRWIAPYATAEGAKLRAVEGADRLQARGRKALPPQASVTVRSALDANSVRLTLRMVTSRLGLELPAELALAADEPFAALSAGVLNTVPGSLFFGSFDEDAAETVDRLVRRGVRMFVSDKPVRGSDGAALPRLSHPRPRAAFQELCAWIAELYPAKTIAVTGSVGKTSTKEMVQLVCSQSFSTLYSAGNQNGVAQVGRYIQKLTTDTQVFIQETGAARPGSVEAGARMLHPDAFIITNIGVNHIGNYGGSQDAILADKASHDRYLPHDGVAFLNYDDEKLRGLSLDHRIISYAIDDTTADYHAEDVEERDGRLTFTIVEADTGSRVECVVHAFGRHNVSNAVVAYAVGRWLGMPVDRILAGIRAYRGEGLRQNLTELGGRKVLVDCYNASEIAMVSTADTLQRITVPEGGRRVLVFADIDDKLGDITEEVHRRVGRQLAAEAGIDLFVCFGEHTAWTAEELKSAGRKVFHTTDRSELHRYLEDALELQDLVAFKGGQQMALSITIDTLFGSSFVLLDGDVLLRRGTDLVADGVRYRDIREFGIEARGLVDQKQTSLVIPSELDGVPIHMVGKGAFRGTSLESVVLQSPMRTLAPSAFYQCRDLVTIELPDSLRALGRSAFNGCTSLREVRIPDGVTTIGARAFYRCENLERVWIPSSVRTIEEEVFSYSRSVVIECEAGSFADVFCRAHWPARVVRNP